MREAEIQHPVDVCHEVAVLWHSDIPRRHSTKHGVGPETLLACLRLIINDFLRHALIHLNVVLFQAFALHYRGKINQSYQRKSQDAYRNPKRVFMVFNKLIHIFIVKDFSIPLRFSRNDGSLLINNFNTLIINS